MPRATKFNPHHDERGRFATAGNGVEPKYKELHIPEPAGLEDPDFNENVALAAAPGSTIAARILPIIGGALGIGVIANENKDKIKQIPLNMDEDSSGDASEGSGGNSSEGGNNKKPNDPKDDKESEWSFGTYKSKERWGNQMKERKWTEQEITDTIKTGKADPAPNYINKGNTATRYTDSQSGKFVVRDDVTKEIIQIGDKDFIPNSIIKSE